MAPFVGLSTGKKHSRMQDISKYLPLSLLLKSGVGLLAASALPGSFGFAPDSGQPAVAVNVDKVTVDISPLI